MYGLIRQGRLRWVSAKLLRIWLSAVMLAMAEVFLSVLSLFPCLEWTLQWGKLYHSLALTDGGEAYGVKLFFPYELMKENNALITILVLFGVLCMTTGLTGTLLFALSAAMGRRAAVLAGAFLVVLPVISQNLRTYPWQPWISFFLPFSWMDLLLLYGKTCRPAPTFAWIHAATMDFGLLFYVVSYQAVKRKDLNWTEEE